MKDRTMRLGYYIDVGRRDALRSQGVWANVVIVAGIGLPILLLLGLQRGLVTQFRADILKSPTAREIRIGVARADRVIGRTRESEMERTIPGLALVIPDVTKVAELELPGGPKHEVTLQCTKPGDPFLAFYDADVLSAADHRGVVLSEFLAHELGIRYERSGRGLQPLGATQLVLRVARKDGQEGTEYRTADLTVRAIWPTGSSRTSTAYLGRQMMDLIQDFSYGRTVAALGWPGLRRSARPRYDGYLAFVREPYVRDDLDKLKLRGLTATPLLAPSPEQRAWRQLYGLLRLHTLSVYWVRPGFATATSRATVDSPPDEVEDITDADDVIMPWSRPSVANLDSIPCRLVGVTVRSRWLKEYFRNPATRLAGGDEERQVLLPFDPPATPNGVVANTATLRLALGRTEVAVSLARRSLSDDGPRLDGTAAGRWLEAGLARLGVANPVAAHARLDRLARRVAIDPEAAGRSLDALVFGPQTPPVAVVPADLAAHLAELQAGHVTYDGSLGLFVPAAIENQYSEARVYAADLELVPAVHEALARDGYLPTSSTLRVREMQGYARTLRLLVWTVTGAVLIFGLWTAISVFGDVTARKRGAIGIVRILGVSPGGVFCIVFVRALVVGVFGGLITLGVGGAGAAVLNAIHASACLIRPLDMVIVFSGVLVCCLLGVIAPAIRAMLLNPVDAISTARTH